MTMHDYDSNIIMGEPIKSRTEAELLRVFMIMHKKIMSSGIDPKMHRLDNECLE